MPAELWRLKMENGMEIDVLVANTNTPAELDTELYKHVPPFTTIYSRELFVRYSYAPFSLRVSREDAEWLRHG
jgi:hypothetical protein